MPSGLECWDAAGKLMFGVTSSLVKFLAFFDIPTSSGNSGSITDTRFTSYAQHVPFFARVDGLLPDPQYDAVVSISGNVLSWSWPDSSRKPLQTIVYGIL